MSSPSNVPTLTPAELNLFYEVQEYNAISIVENYVYHVCETPEVAALISDFGIHIQHYLTTPSAEQGPDFLQTSYTEAVVTLVHTPAAIQAGIRGGVRIEYDWNGVRLRTANPFPPGVECEGQQDGEQREADGTNTVKGQPDDESES